MSFMGDLQKAILERPLTDEEREYHEEAGESFHAPVIVHRSGGVSAERLNVCGICGAEIIPGEGRWIAVTEETADTIRSTR